MATSIQLPARLDVAAAITLREKILGSRGDITLRAGDVVMLGAQSLQVLLAAKHHQEGLKLKLTMEEPSLNFKACLKDLGATLDHITTQESTDANPSR